VKESFPEWKGLFIFAVVSSQWTEADS